jgi:hypothetical protein
MKDKELKLEEIEASHTLVERGKVVCREAPFFPIFFFYFSSKFRRGLARRADV